MSFLISEGISLNPHTWGTHIEYHDAPHHRMNTAWRLIVVDSIVWVRGEGSMTTLCVHTPPMTDTMTGCNHGCYKSDGRWSASIHFRHGCKSDRTFETDETAPWRWPALTVPHCQVTTPFSLTLWGVAAIGSLFTIACIEIISFLSQALGLINRLSLVEV